MTSVPRRPLTKGLLLPLVINGLGPMADNEEDGRVFDIDQAALAMSPYVDAGLTAFDTADPRGPAELVAGIFGDRAERLTHWAPRPGPISRDDVREAVERSLRRLRADHIDLLQFGAWAFAGQTWLDVLFHLQDLKREGLIRHIGVAGFDAAHLRVAVQSGLEIASNQVSFSLLDRRAAGPLTDFCLAHNISLLAQGTLLGGFLSEAWLGHAEPDWELLPSLSLMKFGRFIRAAGGWKPFQQFLRGIDEVSTKHGTPMAAVAMRAILNQEAVAAVVVGARLTRSEHIEDTLKVFELSLDDEDQKTIARAQKYLKPLSRDCGDEVRKPPYLTATGLPAYRTEDAPPPYPVRPGPKGRTLVVPGDDEERPKGFCLAHRLDNSVWVSGTQASRDGKIVGGNDVIAQFHFIIDRIEGALHSLGATLDDVVRTRVLVRNAFDAEDVARAYQLRFRSIMPANTLAQGSPIGEEYLVEVEAEAVVNG